jgi:predicted O-methyltransferase YrrM
VQGIIPPSAGYDEHAFKALRREVKASFKGSWTSFTSTMERLVYALTSVKRPRCLVELGCFWGNTLAWFAGPCIGSRREYQAERIYGVDFDAKMLAKARENFAKLPNGEAVELIAEDARTALERIPGPIDVLYLEAKDESPGGKPGLYLELLKQAYDKLPKGAWVLAHDVTDPDSREEVDIYLPWVHDKAHFVESICFDIDHCGLELSVK